MKALSFAGLAVGAAALSLLLLTGGCLNSEGDYERLAEQSDGLKAELDVAAKENEILTAALANINGEKERLAKALEKTRAAEGVALAGGEAAAAADGTGGQAQDLAAATDKIYVAKRGDILFGIAASHNTTVQELLALNPYLTKRNANMVWEDDRIQLP